MNTIFFNDVEVNTEIYSLPICREKETAEYLVPIGTFVAHTFLTWLRDYYQKEGRRIIRARDRR